MERTAVQRSQATGSQLLPPGRALPVVILPWGISTWLSSQHTGAERWPWSFHSPSLPLFKVTTCTRARVSPAGWVQVLCGSAPGRSSLSQRWLPRAQTPSGKLKTRAVSTSKSLLCGGRQGGRGGRVCVYLVSRDNRLAGSQRDRQAAKRDSRHQSGNATP